MPSARKTVLDLLWPQGNLNQTCYIIIKKNRNILIEEKSCLSFFAWRCMDCHRCTLALARGLSANHFLLHWPVLYNGYKQAGSIELQIPIPSGRTTVCSTGALRWKNLKKKLEGFDWHHFTRIPEVSNLVQPDEAGSQTVCAKRLRLRHFRARHWSKSLLPIWLQSIEHAHELARNSCSTITASGQLPSISWWFQNQLSESTIFQANFWRSTWPSVKRSTVYNENTTHLRPLSVRPWRVTHSGP